MRESSEVRVAELAQECARLEKEVALLLQSTDVLPVLRAELAAATAGERAAQQRADQYHSVQPAPATTELREEGIFGRSK